MHFTGVECLSKWNYAKPLVTCRNPVWRSFPPARPRPMPSSMSENFFTFAMSQSWEGELLSFIGTAGVFGEKSRYPTPLSALTERVWLPTLPWHQPVPQDAIIWIWIGEQWDSEDIPLPERKAVQQLFWVSWLLRLYMLITSARRQF